MIYTYVCMSTCTIHSALSTYGQGIKPHDLTVKRGCYTVARGHWFYVRVVRTRDTLGGKT